MGDYCYDQARPRLQKESIKTITNLIKPPGEPSSPNYKINCHYVSLLIKNKVINLLQDLMDSDKDFPTVI